MVECDLCVQFSTIMFDFEASNWEVDKTAEALNISLFGSAKKQKLQNAKGSPHTKSKVHGSTILPDSDDETVERLTKKDKRKLKERNRKKQKLKKESGQVNGDVHDDGDDDDVSDLEVIVKSKQSKQKNSKVKPQGLEQGKLSKIKKQKEYVGGNDTLTTAIKQKTSKKGQDEISENVNSKKKGKKRKLTDAESEKLSEEQSVTKKQKVVTGDNEVGEGQNADGSEKKKRRKNRKKKNNSKNNKYKHLALNKEKDKSVCDSEGDASVTNKLEDMEVDNSPSCIETKSLPVHSQTEESGVTLKEVLKPKKKKNKTIEHKDLSSKNVKVIEKSEKKQFVDNDMNSVKPIESKAKRKLKKNLENASMNGEENITENLKQLKKPKLEISKKSPQPGKLQDSQARYKKEVLAKLLNESSMLVESTEKTPKSQMKNDRSNKHPNLSTPVAEGQISTLSNLPGQIPDKSESETKSTPTPSANASIWGKAAILSQQARDKLDSARFRYINEQLYSCKGNEALQLFRRDKEAFHVYHEGYRNQVSKWGVNPLDVIIKQFGNKPESLVVADFGCGEAKLAQSVPQKVHSFDLMALNNRVTVCDMSKTPLTSESIDVAVFCLSLMGTNLKDYVREANRVLKPGGLLKVAEVTSRFKAPSSFIDAVSAQGFMLLNKRELSQMFYLMDFKKLKTVKKSTPGPEISLKPCVYKKR